MPWQLKDALEPRRATRRRLLGTGTLAAASGVAVAAHACVQRHGARAIPQCCLPKQRTPRFSQVTGSHSVQQRRSSRRAQPPFRVQAQVTPEEWGGETPFVNISAKQGEGVEELLEMVALVAELEEFSANPDRAAQGTVLESHLDRHRGPVASLLVQAGTLQVRCCR